MLIQMLRSVIAYRVIILDKMPASSKLGNEKGRDRGGEGGLGSDLPNKLL